MNRPARFPRRFAILGLLCGLLAAAPSAAHPAFFQVPPGATPARADTAREVEVSADAGSLLDEDGQRVRRLVGNVHVKQDSTLLWSDEAIQYVSREEFFFTGNVLIVERGDTLRADTVFYHKPTKLGRARGRVFLTDGDVEVRAPAGLYFAEEKRARFSEGLTLTDSLAEITSREGTYWSDEKRAELQGEVRLQAERSYLEADSLTYFRETEISIARSNVFMERLGGEDDAEADSTIRTLLVGQHVYNDEQAGVRRVAGRPLLVQLRQDSTGAEVDTLVIRALRLEALDQDSLQRLVAVDSVQIWQSGFAAVADSVVYERFTRPTADTLAAGTVSADTVSADTVSADVSSAGGRREAMRLYRRPMVWVEEAQVSGDTIRVQGRDGDIDSLFVRRNTFIAQRDSATGRIQQLRGQHLVGVFETDSTRTFTVAPNAEVIYFRRKDDRDVATRASGDQVLFRFHADTLKSVLFPGESQGTHYPEALIPTPFQLDGFRWLPERRPTRAGLIREARMLRRLDPRAGDETIPTEDAPPPADSKAADSGEAAPRKQPQRRR